MPVLRFTAQNLANIVTVASERRDCKIKLTFIMVDNTLGLADRTITLRDHFVPDFSFGSPGPAAPATQDIDKLTFTVVITGCVSLRDELKNIEFLGDLMCYADAIDGGCIITIAFEFV
jgi:hypothetical protein